MGYRILSYYDVLMGLLAILEVYMGTLEILSSENKLSVSIVKSGQIYYF